MIFSRKASRVDHPVVTFNNSPVARTPCQKHLGLYLDERLNFSHHIKEKISKACKGIGVIRNLHYILPRHSLLTIYKESFFQGWNPSFSEGTPPFWVHPFFWSKFKKLPPSFWQPSKSVQVNCKKHLKMKVLCFIPYKVNWEYH